MAANSVVVTLVGDATKLNKAFSDSEKGAKTWGDKMGSAGKSMTMGLTLPIVAGAGLAVNAAAEEQQQMEVLANAIRNNVPGATDEAIAANEEWITSMQNASGIADSELRNSIQQLVQAGVPLEEAQRQTAAAMDISVAKGIDLATVTNAMVKANQGNTGALKKLGIETEDATGAALDMDGVLQNVADTMGGSAAAAADTAAGKAAIMQAKMADLTESIGSILIPIMEQLVGWLTKAVDWFQNLDPAAQKIIVVIAGVAAAIGPVLLIGAKLISAFSQIGKAFGVLSKIMSANPWLLLIAAVVALVILIVTNWDKIVAYLKKVWDWIKKTSAAVWDAIKNALKAALDWIVKLFMNWTLPGLIMKHWDKIKEGVGKVAQFFKDVWNGIVDFFKKIPGRISDAVSGMWNGVKTAFRSAVNWIIRKWNNLSISIGGGKVLGVSIPKIKIETPNIPEFHSGGTFRASTPGGEGLALLRDREQIIPPGGRGSGGGTASPVYIEINAGFGTDPNAISKAVFEALQRYQRINGPLALDVRLN